MMCLSESKCMLNALTSLYVWTGLQQGLFIVINLYDLVEIFVPKIEGSLNGSFPLGVKNSSSVLCLVPWKGWCSEQPRCCSLWSQRQSTNKPACPFIKAQSFSKDCANFNEFLIGTCSLGISVWSKRAREKNKQKETCLNTFRNSVIIRRCS